MLLLLPCYYNLLCHNNGNSTRHKASVPHISLSNADGKLGLAQIALVQVGILLDVHVDHYMIDSYCLLFNLLMLCT